MHQLPISKIKAKEDIHRQISKRQTGRADVEYDENEVYQKVRLITKWIKFQSCTVDYDRVRTPPSPMYCSIKNCEGLGWVVQWYGMSMSTVDS